MGKQSDPDTNKWCKAQLGRPWVGSGTGLAHRRGCGQKAGRTGAVASRPRVRQENRNWAGAGDGRQVRSGRGSRRVGGRPSGESGSPPEGVVDSIDPPKPGRTTSAGLICANVERPDLLLLTSAVLHRCIVGLRAWSGITKAVELPMQPSR